MAANENSHGGIIAVVSFAITALLASLLLLVALVMALGDMVGSLLLSMVIVGGLFAIVAAAIYHYSLRDMFRLLGEQLRTIYEVAQAAQSGYDWARKRIEGLFKVK